METKLKKFTLRFNNEKSCDTNRKHFEYFKRIQRVFSEKFQTTQEIHYENNAIRSVTWYWR